MREIFKAISRLSSSSHLTVKVEVPLRAEIEYWRFIDEWTDCLSWRSEHHATVTLYCDASKRAWGGTLSRDGQDLASRDYWLDNFDDINILEARALLCSLVAFHECIGSCRVDVHTDSRVLISAIENEGCKSSGVNSVLKEILCCCRQYNFTLAMHYLPSGENPADTPSRKRSDLDCMLSREAWEQVERLYSPHTFDLMALDSNCQRDTHGRCLPHFTPCHTPESLGLNSFA